MKDIKNISVKKIFSALFVVFVFGAGFCSSAAAVEDMMDDGSLSKLMTQWKGDYGQMVEKRIIRFLIPFNKTFFFCCI
jgi:hypothetical protein